MISFCGIGGVFDKYRLASIYGTLILELGSRQRHSLLVVETPLWPLVESFGNPDASYFGRPDPG